MYDDSEEHRNSLVFIAVIQNVLLLLVKLVTPSKYFLNFALFDKICMIL